MAPATYREYHSDCPSNGRLAEEGQQRPRQIQQRERQPREQTLSPPIEGAGSTESNTQAKREKGNSGDTQMRESKAQLPSLSAVLVWEACWCRRTWHVNSFLILAHVLR